MAARFNNQVEIEPIVKLIPEYEEKQFTESDYKNPTLKEYMALCCSVSCTIGFFDQFRPRRIKKDKILLSDEKRIIEKYSAPSNSPKMTSKFRTWLYDHTQGDYIDSNEVRKDESYEATIKDA